MKTKLLPALAEDLPSSNSLTNDVRTILLDWIRAGRFPPGSQLPSVPELVGKLNVSRTVVREAMQTLVGMNLVSIRPGVGCFVNSALPEFIVNGDVVGALLDMDALIEVAIARRAIESSVAQIVAGSASEEDFEDIEEALFRIELVAQKNKPMYTVTPDFHVAVARASHNRVLEKVVASFNALMVSAGEVIEREFMGPAYRTAEFESHRRLLEVFRTRDPDLARREMEIHISKTVDDLVAVRDRSR